MGIMSLSQRVLGEMNIFLEILMNKLSSPRRRDRAGRALLWRSEQGRFYARRIAALIIS